MARPLVWMHLRLPGCSRPLMCSCLLLLRPPARLSRHCDCACFGPNQRTSCNEAGRRGRQPVAPQTGFRGRAAGLSDVRRGSSGGGVSKCCRGFRGAAAHAASVLRRGKRARWRRAGQPRGRRAGQRGVSNPSGRARSPASDEGRCANRGTLTTLSPEGTRQHYSLGTRGTYRVVNP